MENTAEKKYRQLYSYHPELTIVKIFTYKLPMFLLLQMLLLREKIFLLIFAKLKVYSIKFKKCKILPKENLKNHTKCCHSTIRAHNSKHLSCIHRNVRRAKRKRNRGKKNVGITELGKEM